MNEKKKFGTAQKANGSCSCVDKNDIPNNKNNNTKGGNAWVGGVLITNFEGGKNEIPILREKRNKHLQLPGESEEKKHVSSIGGHSEWQPHGRANAS